MPNNENSISAEGLDLKEILAELEVPFGPRAGSFPGNEHVQRQETRANCSLCRSARLYRPAKRAFFTPGMDAGVSDRDHKQHHVAEEG